MTSSGGGDSGAGAMAMMMQGSPAPGLPIAGKDSHIDPYTYGQFQSFLPDPVAEGPNPMATGLRPDMFKYRSPTGVLAEGGNSGNVDGQIQELRDQLAQLTAGSQTNPFGGTAGTGMLPASAFMGGGGMPGTMGMGGRGGIDPNGAPYTSVSPQGLATSRNWAVGPQYQLPKGAAPGTHPEVKIGG